MPTITTYTIENRDGEEIVAREFSQSEHADAVIAARQYHGMVICNEYEWTDSYMLEDFTEATEDEPDDA